MTSQSTSRRLHVLLAAGVIILLAGGLGVRLLATPADSGYHGPPTPAEAFVPGPIPLDLSKLEVPNWGRAERDNWSVDYKTNLDLLAPLGTGELNAATWFVDFTKEPAGLRLAESKQAMDARVSGPVGWLDKVFPSDHPFLTEAEPWCDQARMEFYSKLMEPDGWQTPVPNLLVPLTIARSWVARGLAAEDPDEAMEDFRRAIRLGRLLRQENIVIITDLVGLACIDAGARGIYDVAHREGNLELALLAAIVVGEHAPQRFMTRQQVVDPDGFEVVRLEDRDEFSFGITNQGLKTLLERAESNPDARFRNEAIIFLGIVRQYGTPEQQSMVVDLLTSLLESPEPGVAENARWALDVDTTDEELAELFEVH